MNEEELEKKLGRNRDAITNAIDWLIADRNTKVTTSSQWHEVDKIINELVSVRKAIYIVLNEFNMLTNDNKRGKI